MSDAKKIYNVNFNTQPNKPKWSTITVNYQLGAEFLNQMIISGMKGEKFDLDHYLKLGLPHNYRLNYVSGILPMRFDHDGQIMVHVSRSDGQQSAEPESTNSAGTETRSSSAAPQPQSASSSTSSVNSASSSVNSSSEDSAWARSVNSERSVFRSVSKDSASVSLNRSLYSSEARSYSDYVARLSASASSASKSSYASSVRSRSSSISKGRSIFTSGEESASSRSAFRSYARSSSSSVDQSSSSASQRSSESSSARGHDKVIPVKDPRDDISTVLMALGYSLGALGKSVDDLHNHHRPKM